MSAVTTCPLGGAPAGEAGRTTAPATNSPPSARRPSRQPRSLGLSQRSSPHVRSEGWQVEPPSLASIPAAFRVVSNPMPPEPASHSDASRLMSAAAGGDRAAADQLLPLVYEQLRKAAQLQMAGERNSHTLSATALVHDAYLRLAGPRDLPWANRAHFYAAAAQAMRRILLDHARARSRRAGEAGPARRFEDMGDVADLAAAQPDQIVAVDDALTRLEATDAQAASMVRLRFYAGLSVEQASEALGLSPRSGARLWSYARAALYRLLSES